MSYFIFSTHWAKFADGTKVQEIKRNILLLGEDKKCYERQEHTSCSEGSPWALTRVSIRMEKRLQCERGSARIRGRNYHRVALAHNFSILDDNFSLLLGSCLTINMN